MAEQQSVRASRCIAADCDIDSESNARIVVLTTYKGDAQSLSALGADASGYLLKSMLRKELLDITRGVHAGPRRMPPKIAAVIADHAAHQALSDREIEVLKCVTVGGAKKRLAMRLYISEETVNAHIRTVLSNLGAEGLTDAVTSR